MTEGFVKVDCGMLDSSIWVERDQRSIFMTMLLMGKPYELLAPEPQLSIRSLAPTGWEVPAGWYGIVRASASGIIERDKIPDKEIGYQVLEALSAPDPESRSQEYEGRRIARVNGGYLVLNYFAYRDRDYTARDRMRRMRERKNQQVIDFGEVASENGDQLQRNGSNVQQNVTQAESREQRAEIQTTEKKGNGGSVPALPAIKGRRTYAAIIERLGSVMDEVARGARTRVAQEQLRRLQAETVFAYWMKKYNHDRAIMDDKRERIIVARLDENQGDVSEILYALDGATRDPWVMGKTDRSTHPNDGVEYLLANRARVEQFANMAKHYREGKTHAVVEKYAAIIHPQAAKQIPAGESAHE